MIALVLVLLQAPAAAPVTPPAVSVEAGAPASSRPEDTLAGLEQIYSSTCNQTGILYHAYDDLCEGVRKQITAYRRQMDRDAAKAQQAKAAGKKP